MTAELSLACPQHADWVGQKLVWVAKWVVHVNLVVCSSKGKIMATLRNSCRCLLTLTCRHWRLSSRGENAYRCITWNVVRDGRRWMAMNAHPSAAISSCTYCESRTSQSSQWPWSSILLTNSLPVSILATILMLGSLILA